MVQVGQRVGPVPGGALTLDHHLGATVVLGQEGVHRVGEELPAHDHELVNRDEDTAQALRCGLPQEDRHRG